MAELFRGRKDLFDGLWIGSSNYDWKPHPVLSLNLATVASTSPEELVHDLNLQLVSKAARMGIELTSEARPGATLDKLIVKLRKKGRVALLIDEYDGPLVKNITRPEISQANRRVLHDFFSMIKDLEQDLQFVFLTGVSRFTKMSLFSGLNNLQDISFSREYATITGFTEEEIVSAFSPHLEAVSKQRSLPVEQVIEKMRRWYNGYLFADRGPAPRVYNPWSVIQFLASGEFENYWVATGTPTFAVEQIRERNWTLGDLQRQVIARDNLRNSWEVDRIELVALLYQSGYLTIEEATNQEREESSVSLRIPNAEVQRSLVSHLLVTYSGKDASDFEQLRTKLRKSLNNTDMDLFFGTFNTLLADISSRLHIPQERFYHALLHMCLLSLGFTVQTEVETNRGRIDMVVELPDRIYLFELKIDHSAKSAIKQIRETGYADKFRLKGKPVELVGMKCSSKLRAVEEWQHEPL